MAHMDTTPPSEVTEGPADHETADHEAELEAMAALDPADAPEAAERLAAELARDLDTVGAEPQPEQLAAPFSGDQEEPA